MIVTDRRGEPNNDKFNILYVKFILLFDENTLHLFSKRIYANKVSLAQPVEIGGLDISHPRLHINGIECSIWVRFWFS